MRTPLAKAIEDETDAERLGRARAEMDDEEKARHERLLKEEKELQQVREESRIRVGVSADDLRRVVGAAMARAGTALDHTRGNRGQRDHVQPRSFRSRLLQGCDRQASCLRDRDKIAKVA
jgi:hypothetical protein